MVTKPKKYKSKTPVKTPKLTKRNQVFGKTDGKEYQKKNRTVLRNSAAAVIKERGYATREIFDRYTENPFWPTFNRDKAEMLVDTFEWVDDNPANTIRFYPQEDLLVPMFQVEKLRSMAVMLCLMKVASIEGQTTKDELVEEVQKYYVDTTNRSLLLMINSVLNSLIEVNMICIIKKKIFINPTFAFRGDRGVTVRYLHGGA